MVLIVETNMPRDPRPDIAEPRDIPGKRRLPRAVLAAPPWPGPPVPRPSRRHDETAPDWRPV